jgi:hypothetical protein
MKISLLLGLLALTLHAEGQHTYETGTLRCSVYGRANAYSHFPVRIGEKAYSLAVEIEDVVFLATELGSGAFATRRFDPDEWIIGDKVQVSLDEAKHKILLRAAKGKDIVLGYTRRIRVGEWEGCTGMIEEMSAKR